MFGYRRNTRRLFKSQPDAEQEAIANLIRNDRAKRLEGKQAFDAVIRLREDLAQAVKLLGELMPHLAIKSFHREFYVQDVERCKQRIATLESELADAEAFANQACPERLAAHDAALMKADQEAKEAAEREAAEHAERIEEGRRKAAISANERLEARQRQIEERRALLASLGFEGAAQ